MCGGGGGGETEVDMYTCVMYAGMYMVRPRVIVRRPWIEEEKERVAFIF